MSIRTWLWTGLLALVVCAGAAAAQEEVPCPECDEDGEPDDSWYSSYDTGVISDEGGVLEDTDVSVGENEHGDFTWFQYCLQFFDAMGNHMSIMWEAFVSEDGADVDAKVNVNGEEIDLEDTLIGDADDATWGAMDSAGVDLPSIPRDELPEGQDVDECLYLEDGLEWEGEPLL